jgi:hypothetical protein
MALIDEIKKAKDRKKINSAKDREFLKIEAEIVAVFECEPAPEGSRDELRKWMVEKCGDPRWKKYCETKSPGSAKFPEAEEIPSQENSGKLENEKNAKNEETDIRCPACSSLEVWLPRIPGVDRADAANWRCCKCHPIRNRSMVLEIRSVDAQESDRRALAGSLGLDTFAPQTLGTVVLALEGSACLVCKCSLVKESPNAVGGVDWKCFCCGSGIDPARKVDRWQFTLDRFTKPEPVWKQLEKFKNGEAISGRRG